MLFLSILVVVLSTRYGFSGLRILAEEKSGLLFLVLSCVDLEVDEEEMTIMLILCCCAGWELSRGRRGFAT